MSKSKAKSDSPFLMKRIYIYVRNPLRYFRNFSLMQTIMFMIFEYRMRRFPVILRIYDLSKGKALLFSQSLLGYKIEGVWHTSLEVHGTEIWFGRGITTAQPDFSAHGKALKTVLIGYTRSTHSQIKEKLKELSKHYTEHSYHLFDKNCNHFSNELSILLTNKGIPRDILELAENVRNDPRVLNLMSFMGLDNLVIS